MGFYLRVSSEILDDEIISFTPYVRNSLCGTMKIVPYGMREYSLDLNGPQNDENQEVIHAMNTFLDYDSDGENARGIQCV